MCVKIVTSVVDIIAGSCFCIKLILIILGPVVNYYAFVATVVDFLLIKRRNPFWNESQQGNYFNPYFIAMNDKHYQVKRCLDLNSTLKNMLSG